MQKKLLIILFGLLIFQKVSAQKEKDTVLYAVKNNGQLVNTKDSADYFIFNLPADPNTGLYKVVEVYRGGRPKLIGNAQTRASSFTLEGACTDFYPTGKRKSIMVYKNDQPVGDVIKYYPNGQLYISEELDQNNRLLLMECHDSTGVVLAKNGNGKWITFDDRFKEVESGPVINGLEDGEWHGTLNDTAKYVCSFKAGNIISGVDYYREKKVYTAVDVEPDFKGGIAAFYNFLGRAIHYPAVDREHNITGKVLVTFAVERDGSITGVKIAKGVSKTIDEETLRVIRLSPPWIPGSQHGRAVRVQFTVPVNFPFY